MAIMYPKNINLLDPEESELEVYNQLKKQLDDNYTVFYSVEWNKKRKDGSLEKSEADFIIENPKYGFLCLEVKGGESITISNDGIWTLHTRKYGERLLDRSPYRQAEESMYYFKEKYKKEYNIEYSGLYGAGAIFPFYVLPQAESISNRDEICTIEAPDMSDLDIKIKNMFKAWGGQKFGRNRYSDQEHEFFLDMVRKRTAMAAAAGALIKFKERQLDEINRVQDNYIYLVSNLRQFYMRGGAGTGKTWIAMKMALDEASKGNRVLLTCKSKALAEVLDIYTQNKVDVYDLDLLRTKGIHGVYDAIFVDEAQDFSEEDAFNLKLYLKDEKISRLGVFYDDIQKVREESFGNAFMIDIPPLLLHENIRNTSNIYHYATKETKLGQDVITNPVEGPSPKCEKIKGKKKLEQRLNNILKEFLVDECLNVSSIVILTNDKEDFIKLFPEGIAKWKLVDYRSDKENAIRISTVSDFKGLESDVIIYIHKHDDSNTLNYIAYTRAKYYLLELILD